MVTPLFAAREYSLNFAGAVAIRARLQRYRRIDRLHAGVHVVFVFSRVLVVETISMETQTVGTRRKHVEREMSAGISLSCAACSKRSADQEDLDSRRGRKHA